MTQFVHGFEDMYLFLQGLDLVTQLEILRHVSLKLIYL